MSVKIIYVICKTVESEMDLDIKESTANLIKWISDTFAQFR